MKNNLQVNKDRIVEIFLTAAKINALSGNEKPIALFIKDFLSSYNYSVFEDNAVEFTKSNTGNLIIKLNGGGDTLLLSHLDTARPTSDLVPVITDDKITSSGNTVLGVDNRAGVATLLYLLESIHKLNLNHFPFTVAFTTCEETTLWGSKYLQMDSKIKKAFVFDSGYRPGSFIYSACGALGFKMKIIGRASHSGIAPEEGINSMLAASNAIGKLPLGRIDEETTMNIGLLKSGSAVNVIPELTELEGEVRSFNLKKAEAYYDLLVNTFKHEAEAVNATIEVENFWDFVPYTINNTDEIYQDISRAIEGAGLSVTPKISLGGSDANSLNERGVKAVNIGIGAQNPHSNEEFIFIEDLVKAGEIAFELVIKD